MEIKKYNSPNFFKDRLGNKPDIVVLHNTGGTSISSAHHWFLNNVSYTSAHFLVGLDGEVRQYVDLKDGAWCNGTSADKTQNAFYGNATNNIVKNRSQNANLYTVSIEFVGNVSDVLTEKQIETAVQLINHIKIEVKKIYGRDLKIDREHLIGHYEIVPKTRAYCGKNIQYNLLIDRLKIIEMVEEKIQETKAKTDIVIDNPFSADDEPVRTKLFMPKKLPSLKRIQAVIHKRFFKK